MEVFSEGQILQLDNFRKLKSYGRSPSLRLPKLSRSQDKGHESGFHAFLEAVRNGTDAPIPFTSIVNTTRATFGAVESARSGQAVPLV